MIQPFKKKNHFDVFISYRYNETTHSASLARAIAQELQLKGYRVYYDSWYYDKIKWNQAYKNSDNYVVLLTDYSFADEKDEDHFKEEVEYILEKAKDRTWKGKALWLDVDRRYNSYIENKQKEKIELLDIEKNIVKNTYTPFWTHNVKSLIDKHLGCGEKPFKKFPLVKQSTWVRLGKWFAATSLLLATALVWCGVRLAQYSGPGILFAGGGSVKNYIANKMGVDVNDYGPNSKYVHMPSTAAYDLLWDYINDSSSYYPIVLSAGEMDTSKFDTKRFKNRSKKILQYRLGDVALLVQLRNYEGTKYKKGDSIITIDDLSILLSDTTIKKICYTTSKGSGTYTRYEAILPLGFRDSNYTVFTPEDYDVGEKTTLHIYLANESYAIKEKEDDHVLSLKIIDSIGGPAKMLGLFLYAVGEHNTQGTKYMPSAPVKKFFKKLNLDINEDLYYNDKEDMIIKLN